jgi:hypothetical protein
MTEEQVREKFEKRLTRNSFYCEPGGSLVVDLNAALECLEEFGQAASEITRHPSEQLVIDLARELYDRFAMGGWEPQDAHQMIRDMLAASEITQAPQVCPGEDARECGKPEGRDYEIEGKEW